MGQSTSAPSGLSECGGAAVSPATRFRTKAVRDLAWLIESPAVLSQHAGMELLRAPADFDVTTSEWLRGLDSDPSGILGPLQAQAQRLKRLGFYAAELTQFWLEHGPGWDTRKVVSSVQLSSADSSKQTAGQLKLVCLRPEEALHVESSVKFFAEASGFADSTRLRCTSSYVGPFLHENLAWRLAEAQRKVTSTASARVQAYLQRQLGNVPIRSVYLLKGYIFKPIEEFFSVGPALRNPPLELNTDCPTGWYTSDVTVVMRFLSPGARLAVLPKLFWLSPAVAFGNPPHIAGEQLPGQQEAVPAEEPEKVQQEVVEHLARADTALLLCELVRECGDAEDRWVERSRGFILPTSWDPKALMTGGPHGMKSSEQANKASESCEQPSKWSNQRRKYSERLADTARQPAPSLAGAGVQEIPPLDEELSTEHLVDYVMIAMKSSGSCNPARFQRKLVLRATMVESELRCNGSVCRLVCAALSEISLQGLRTQGHFLLDLLARPSNKATFEADQVALNRMYEQALDNSTCLRLAVKIAFCFQFVPAPVPADRLPKLFGEVLESLDRSRLLGLIEFLAASASLRLDGAEVPLEMILDRLSSPGADAAVLESVCSANPEVCQRLAEKLTSSGQLKLARRIEDRRWRGSAATAVQGTTEKRHGVAKGTPELCLQGLPLLGLPAPVRIVQIRDAECLREVCARAESGGIVGVDAEWRPWVERPDASRERENGIAGSKRDRTCNYTPVQLLQLAWADVVFLLDVPLLHGDKQCRGLLTETLSHLFSPSNGCILVGYGLEGDIRRLANSYPVIMSVAARHGWYGVELLRLVVTQSPNGGLDQVCAMALGRRMDKAMQCSDWDCRPLSQAQVAYAALDAWILLALLGRVMAEDGHNLSRSDEPIRDDDLAAMANLSGHSVDTLARLFDSPSGVCDVANVLGRLGVTDLDAFLVPANTFAATAQSERVIVCRTLACVASGESVGTIPSLAVVSAVEKSELDLPRLARALGADSVRLATAEELSDIFRQPRGSVGPIGPALLQSPRAAVVLDTALLEAGDGSVLSCGAGSPGWELISNARRLVELTGAVSTALVCDG